ncbi:hypothetical protein PsorP6_012804 [Peronosclerospora sorghi]|uniref:Uncharacterized protein n=1 Tax=Peronosclerospora sorghi TaxID=230839 RepID=A0ACC0WEZ5_9STRA|nr:hypothetical protein PsorP6_012804 [Peronosclerospora sorghi]
MTQLFNVILKRLEYFYHSQRYSTRVRDLHCRIMKLTYLVVAATLATTSVLADDTPNLRALAPDETAPNGDNEVNALLAANAPMGDDEDGGWGHRGWGWGRPGWGRPGWGRPGWGWGRPGGRW